MIKKELKGSILKKKDLIDTKAKNFPIKVFPTQKSSASRESQIKPARSNSQNPNKITIETNETTTSTSTTIVTTNTNIASPTNEKAEHEAEIIALKIKLDHHNKTINKLKIDLKQYKDDNVYLRGATEDNEKLIRELKKNLKEEDFSAKRTYLLKSQLIKHERMIKSLNMTIKNFKILYTEMYAQLDKMIGFFEKPQIDKGSLNRKDDFLFILSNFKTRLVDLKITENYEFGQNIKTKDTIVDSNDNEIKNSSLYSKLEVEEQLFGLVKTVENFRDNFKVEDSMKNKTPFNTLINCTHTVKKIIEYFIEEGCSVDKLSAITQNGSNNETNIWEKIENFDYLNEALDHNSNLLTEINDANIVINETLKRVDGVESYIQKYIHAQKEEKFNKLYKMKEFNDFVDKMIKTSNIESKLHSIHLRLMTIFLVKIVSEVNSVNSFIEEHLKSISEQAYNNLLVPLEDIRNVCLNYNKDKSPQNIQNMAINLKNVFEMYSEKMINAVKNIVILGKKPENKSSNESYFKWLLQAVLNKIDKIQSEIYV